MMTQESLGDRLTGPDARRNGFDAIRLFAASAVIISHAFALTQGSEAGEPLYQATRGDATIGLAAVAVFFIVSGLLISLSFDRSRTWRIFVQNRALRLFPGLWVCVILTVFLFGPVVTSLSLGAYFASPQTLGFLGNLVFLPTSHGMGGMFPAHPFSGAVNGSLWTLKYEVACYIGGAILLCFGRWRLAAVATCWAIAMLGTLVGGDPHGQKGVFYHLAQLFWLFRFYGAGMLLYLLRDRIKLSSRAGWLAAAGVIAAVPTLWFTEALATLGAYALLVLAYQAPDWFRSLTRHGDLSYGVYIYAYPIQQMFVPLSLASSSPAFVNMALALPVTCLLAWASWRLVEAPALQLKPRQPRHASS